MERRRFFSWSLVGAVLWATGITLIGYFLGGVTFLQQHLEVTVLLIVVVSTVPIVFEYLRERRRQPARR
jgi:membrane-associated protein